MGVKIKSAKFKSKDGSAPSGIVKIALEKVNATEKKD